MADSKQDVLDMLRELAELTMLEEGDPQSFRVRAYESAAQAIAAQATDLGRLTARELQKIEGIGKSTAEKIRELLETGKVEKLEGLRAEAPAQRGRAAADPGPRSEGAQAAARRARRASRSTICGARSPSRSCAGSRGSARSRRRSWPSRLARLDEQGPIERTPISVALPLAERHRGAHAGAARRHPRVDCGSLRRFSETVGDVDIVVAAAAAEPVMDALVRR